MRKRIYSLCVVMLAAGQIHAHPLEGAVRTLTTLTQDLESAKSSCTDAEKAELVGISDNAVKLWKDALLLPIKTSDVELKELGYWFVPSPNQGDQRYVLRKDPSTTVYIDEAYVFNRSRWLRLANVVKNQIRLNNDTYKMLNSDEFTRGVPAQAVSGSLKFIARDTGLESLQNATTHILACMDKFDPAHNQNGLIPVLAQGDYTWSQEALVKVYGAGSFDQFSVEQKSKAVAALGQLVGEAVHEVGACIPRAKQDFMLAELHKWRGN